MNDKDEPPELGNGNKDTFDVIVVGTLFVTFFKKHVLFVGRFFASVSTVE